VTAANRAREGYVRDPNDFYGTPEWCVRALFKHIIPWAAQSGEMVVEPSAGDGAIVRAMLNVGIGARRIAAVEQDGRHHQALADLGVCVVGGDTLSLTYSNVGLVVMNPPYRKAREHVEHALQQVYGKAGTVAALLRLGFLGSKRRISFWKQHPADVFVLPERPSFTTDGKTDASEYAWFVWGPGRGGKWQVLDLEEDCLPVKKRRAGKQLTLVAHP